MTEESMDRAVAIVGAAAIMPDAPDGATFWQNIKDGRYSISEVTSDRWDPALYYDPDPRAPDKTYSKIGGWVRDFEWDPLGWKLPIPPRVSDAMDEAQKWAVNLARAALLDYGWPERPLDTDRTAVVIGNAMAGEKHYMSALRVNFPEFARELEASTTFAALSKEVREAIIEQARDGIRAAIPAINEDTMAGELANIIAGRVANLFNLRGPNYVTDAACASGLAAMAASIDGLVNREYDAVLAGGIDRNMGAATFVKFCKIGALSATGTRPYSDGADGFVMGEGGTLFLLKRLADAELAGDRIYAVLLGIAGASDGKGKGITAPNPIGQRLAVERAWQRSGVAPSTCSLIEGHGTSTAVGDLVELEALAEVFGADGVPAGAIPLGSVKSNIGHLKGAAGTSGLFKAAMALHHKLLPPSINFDRPNANIDFSRVPFTVNTELRPWDAPAGGIRRAGVSAFGFGGTNFHAVLQEHVPGRNRETGSRQVSFSDVEVPRRASTETSPVTSSPPAPVRGALVVGAADERALALRLRAVAEAAARGEAPAPTAPAREDLAAPLRVAIDYGDASELADKANRVVQALGTDNPAMWRALRAQGVFVGRGEPGKVAFLFTGQGSQYVNMLERLRDREPVVAETFEQADRVMTPLLGKPLTEFIFVDGADAAAVERLEQQLLQTEITQPAVLATDIALTRLLAAHGITPDLVMGHSLGEYAALVAAGALTFEAALEAVSARGSEMANLSLADNGAMAAVLAPFEEIERLVAAVDGYVVVANVNSTSQAVIGGATAAVERAVELFREAGHTAVPLPVSHAFHTTIVAPASEPLRATLLRLGLQPPVVPIVANVDGELYPTGPGVQERMLDILALQVASPVQFVKGLHTLYAQGARVFVEVGPKKALHGFVEDVLGKEHDDVLALFTNHPKQGDMVSFNQALCGLYASGLGAPTAPAADTSGPPAVPATESEGATMDNRYLELGHLMADFLEKSRSVWEGAELAPTTDSDRPPAIRREPVVVTGAALGLPGTERVFDDANVARILSGEQFIGSIPHPIREAMADKHITRLVKSEDGARFDVIDSPDDVIKLAARAGAFDVVEEFGVDADRDRALDDCTRLAIGAGFDALRDAGVPLMLHYKTTTVGTKLPERWGLPDALRDDTGVIFASAFPGCGELAKDIERYVADRDRRQELATLRTIRARLEDGEAAVEIDRHMAEIESVVLAEPFEFDRRFLFRILSMGHSQFAEVIGARGPNTQVNSACASTTLAIGLAEDWIRAGRCRRVVIVAADNVTSDSLLGWVGAGFLATGAAATDEVVEEAAMPFDNRRHGMLLGMGAAAIVIESAEAARERGVQPICEVLAAVTANSAFHGTKLDVDHITEVMEKLVAQAEAGGVDRHAIASETVFVSHETYTPARGGSAQAEISALRAVFGPDADHVVIANTKGFTGHPMGVGIEDVVAIKTLETGLVPPVPNFKEVDPNLGELNLSIGGTYPVRYALRLAAGFGSQISMVLLRWTPVPDGLHRHPSELGYTYRIVDPASWHRWLATTTGTDDARLEVVQRRLRVTDTGPGGDVSPARPEPVTVEPAAVEPTTPPEAEPEPEMAPAAPAAAIDVESEILALVADKTGYPADMLALDLDLEADLGIDTVKQAEVFATVRERYGIERDDQLKLRDYPTLADVIGFVRDRTPATPEPVTVEPAAVEPTTPPEAEPEPEMAPAAPAAAIDVESEILALVADKTGYPADMLALDLDLEADLGIDTVKQAEVFATVRERYGIERDDQLKLRDYPTLADVIGFVRDRTPATPEPVTVEPAAVKPTTPPEAEPEPEMAPAAPAAAIDVESEILALVADKTGYPADMLALDLDLEADLGIDTVKQAEVFATVRERYGIERDDQLKLRDYPTLADVIGFVRDRTPATPEPVTVEPAAVKPTTPPEAEPEPEMAPAAPAAAIDVESEILALVADKTGYPADMLALDLDLEADLGIDTVKQAEVFATVRERYGIERDDQLKLRDYPTLADVIGFVRDRTPATPEPVTVEPAAAPRVAAATPRVRHEVEIGDLADADRIPRRVPVPTIRPPLGACAPTGVELESATRVVVGSDRGGVGAALAERLTARGVEVLTIEDQPDAETLVARIDGWLSAGPIQGVYWLPALDDEGAIGDMDLAGWREANRIRVKLLYTTMRRLYEQIATRGTFLVTATRLGGMHGYDEAGATAPLGGAVTGFAKAFARERPDALVKAVDFGAGSSEAQIADVLVAETLNDPGAVEVGDRDGLRWTITLEDQPAADGGQGMVLGPETVFVVTGAAGSIVSAITADLAGASGGIFHLLDLTPEPQGDDPDIARFVTDKDGLKADLIERLRAAGGRPTPVMVDKELARLERLVAARAAIDAVQAAGGEARYHSVDLTDADAVAQIIAEIAGRDGRIDVLLHAAGLDISHALPDKAPREYDLVFGVKSDGWFNLAKAIGDLPLGATVAFSSVAGRFGNFGQTDYAAANDLLCKLASAMRTTRPATRAIVIDWTAWGGIGMATRGSIPKVMERAGIEVLPPETGVPTIRRELTAGATRGEVVVAGRLGVMLDERAEQGGIDPARFETVLAGPMVGHVVRMGVHGGLVVETTLDPTEQAFLDDHQIEGTPVLPGVMGIEAFAEVARLPLPGWHVAEIDDVEFLAPFKFYRREPRTISVTATFHRDGDHLVAECRLVGSRQLANQVEPQVTTHFTGRVRLARAPVAASSVSAPPSPNGSGATADAIYSVYFHGPAFQVLERAWRDEEGPVGLFAGNLPVSHTPSGSELVSPRLIELFFQTAGIWEIGRLGRFGLPQHVDRIVVHEGLGDPQGRVEALVEPGDAGFGGRVVDQTGRVLLELYGYRTIELPGGVDPDRRAPLAAAMS